MTRTTVVAWLRPALLLAVTTKAQPKPPSFDLCWHALSEVREVWHLWTSGRCTAPTPGLPAWARQMEADGLARASTADADREAMAVRLFRLGEARERLAVSVHEAAARGRYNVDNAPRPSSPYGKRLAELDAKHREQFRAASPCWISRRSNEALRKEFAEMPGNRDKLPPDAGECARWRKQYARRQAQS